MSQSVGEFHYKSKSIGESIGRNTYGAVRDVLPAFTKIVTWTENGFGILVESASGSLYGQGLYGQDFYGGSP